jgi:pimeloyl-ACP methyl ester carboxylesterase
MFWDEFHSDLARAHKRVSSLPSNLMTTPHGKLEYATEGGGSPLLVAHGILGSHVEGIGIARTYVGGDYRVVAPSRFGYFGSDLPPGASAALQADAYASLLDQLDIAQTVALGYSAGGPSVIQLALRHPDRVSALVLMASALPPSSRPPRVLRPLMSAAAGSERLFWLFAHLMPTTQRGMMGVPAHYDPAAEEAAVIEEVGESIFPVRPRRDGFIFDLFISNRSVREARLEALTVPTLILHSADDNLAPYAYAAAAAPRIRDVTFVTIDEGGHLLLGQQQRVRDEVAAFLSTAATGAHAGTTNPG